MSVDITLDEVLNMTDEQWERQLIENDLIPPVPVKKNHGDFTPEQVRRFWECVAESLVRTLPGSKLVIAWNTGRPDCKDSRAITEEVASHFGLSVPS